MKYELEQVVYYLIDNRIHSASIVSRSFVDNLSEIYCATDAQRKMWMPFGKSGRRYSTCHGVFDEGEVFASKEELVEALVSEYDSVPDVPSDLG